MAHQGNHCATETLNTGNCLSDCVCRVYPMLNAEEGLRPLIALIHVLLPQCQRVFNSMLHNWYLVKDRQSECSHSAPSISLLLLISRLCMLFLSRHSMPCCSCLPHYFVTSHQSSTLVVTTHSRRSSGLTSWCYYPPYSASDFCSSIVHARLKCLSLGMCVLQVPCVSLPRTECHRLESL